MCDGSRYAFDPTLSSIVTVPSVSSIDGSEIGRPGPLRSASSACFFTSRPRFQPLASRSSDDVR